MKSRRLRLRLRLLRQRRRRWVRCVAAASELFRGRAPNRCFMHGVPQVGCEICVLSMLNVDVRSSWGAVMLATSSRRPSLHKNEMLQDRPELLEPGLHRSWVEGGGR